MPQHKLELLIEGTRHAGLRSGSVDLSIETLAPSFRFVYAEQVTSADASRILRRGTLVTILVDDEPLVEGYVERSTRKRERDRFELEVSGRGAGCDLVDCAITTKLHHASATVDKIVASLAKPFGFSVRMAPGVPVGEPLKSFKADKSEKVGDAIVRACTRRGLLARVLPLGYTIELDRPDSTLESTPLVNGENCLDMEFEEDGTQLFSPYLIQGRTSETDDAYGEATRIRGELRDPSVTRERPFRVEMRGGDGPSDAGARAKVERNRRLGNSEVIRCTTDGWRDYDGLLWAPNQLRACTDLDPRMELDAAEFLIASAKYAWDETLSKGFTCALELKRREAFDPEASYPVTQAGRAVR